jgi:hypothetical protein
MPSICLPLGANLGFKQAVAHLPMLEQDMEAITLPGGRGPSRRA